jgi:hypothetical protein
LGELVSLVKLAFSFPASHQANHFGFHINSKKYNLGRIPF